jgi:hypothetical protein
MLEDLKIRAALVSDGCGSTTSVEPFTEGSNDAVRKGEHRYALGFMTV